MTVSTFNFGLLIRARRALATFRSREITYCRFNAKFCFYNEICIFRMRFMLSPSNWFEQEEQASGLLPDLAELKALIEYLNISPEHHVVVYDDEGGAWQGV